MINKVTLLGRVGKDPETKQLPNDITVANFSIATNETWKDKDGNKQEKAEWHNCQAWRGLATVIGKYVKKGDLIYVEGKLQTRKYDKDGVTHYATDIVVSEMKMLGGKKGDGSSEGGGPSGPDDGSDLPF